MNGIFVMSALISAILYHLSKFCFLFVVSIGGKFFASEYKKIKKQLAVLKLKNVTLITSNNSYYKQTIFCKNIFRQKFILPCIFIEFMQ